MSLPTLEEFLSSSGGLGWPKNSYVNAPGFLELYVRRTRRRLGGEWVEGVLDIARVEATWPGRGTFTTLVESLLERGIPLYVECVLNERFAKKLEEMGFTQVPHTCSSCFFKLPEKGNNMTTEDNRMRWDEQKRCAFMTDNGQCEDRDDHEGDHETGLPTGHGNPWEYDRCFHFASGDGTRCVYLNGHNGDHDPPKGTT